MTRTIAIGVLAGLLIAASIAGSVLELWSHESSGLDALNNLIYALTPITLAVVGGVLAVRRPDHWSGWTMLIAASAVAIDTLSKGVLQMDEAGHRWAATYVSWAAWFDNWTWTVAVGSLLLIVLKFAGGVPSTRWLRAIGWAGMGVLGLLVVVTMAASRAGADPFRHVRTPIDVGIPVHVVSLLVSSLFFCVLAAFLAATVALIVKWRRSTGVEQAQLRWLMWSFGSVLAGLVISEFVDDVLHDRPAILAGAINAISTATIVTIPIAIYVSVTRYGLFEIDRVISRTASYSVLTALLTISYVLIVTAATRLLPDRFNSFGVAVATLAVAALFLPVRRRLIALMDRRFNRGRVDAEHVISAFAERMRHDDAHDPSGRDLVAAAYAVFQPSHASVWLVPR